MRRISMWWKSETVLWYCREVGFRNWKEIYILVVSRNLSVTNGGF